MAAALNLLVSKPVVPKSGLVGEGRPKWEKILSDLESKVQDIARKAGIRRPVSLEIADQNGNPCSGAATFWDREHAVIQIPPLMLLSDIPEKWQFTGDDGLDGRQELSRRASHLKSLVPEIADYLELPETFKRGDIRHPDYFLLLYLLADPEKLRAAIEGVLNHEVHHIVLIENNIRGNAKAIEFACDSGAARRLGTAEGLIYWQEAYLKVEEFFSQFGARNKGDDSHPRPEERIEALRALNFDPPAPYVRMEQLPAALPARYARMEQLPAPEMQVEEEPDFEFLPIGPCTIL